MFKWTFMVVIVSHRINYTGDVLLTKENHTGSGAPVIVQHEFSYDNAKRLTKTKHKINEQYQLTLSEQKYEETGRLKRKYLQKTTTALQTLDYRYNLRGWLIDINDVTALGNDKFAMKLDYTNAAHAQNNGNIASMKWNTAMFNTQEYQFEYDKANRLKSAATSLGTGNYSTSYIYDKNGNLKNLTRKGRLGSGNTYGFIDELTYQYSGNKLLSVNDVDELNHQYNGFSDNYSFATSEFTYDANGNMVSDQNKDLDMIEYNYLNLPQQINFTEGYQEINYLYTANGQKLMKQTRTDNEVDQTVDYIGSFVYEGDQLSYILTEEGRALAKSNSTFEYQYFLKDHLGNTRITFNQNGQIIQEDAYYPFGMQMNGLCYQSGVDYENKYLYNGKELQDDFGLDWYDYGARMYDPVIGRWHTVDPKAEMFYSWSPYVYALDNPINNIDPDGTAPAPAHYSFYINSAISIYRAAKVEGASTMGALAVIAQAANESGYGNSSPATKFNNFFGLMGGGSGITTVHGELASFSTAGDGISAYFARLNKMWPNALEMFKQDKITADDFNKAFNTGSYEKYPAYMVKTAGSDHDYGTVIMGMTNTIINGMINSIETKIVENKSVIQNAGNLWIKMEQLIESGDLEGAQKLQGQFNKATMASKTAQQQNIELNQIKIELDELKK